MAREIGIRVDDGTSRSVEVEERADLLVDGAHEVSTKKRAMHY